MKLTVTISSLLLIMTLLLGTTECFGRNGDAGRVIGALALITMAGIVEAAIEHSVQESVAVHRHPRSNSPCFHVPPGSTIIIPAESGGQLRGWIWIETPDGRQGWVRAEQVRRGQQG